jgi:hypothetical protein
MSSKQVERIEERRILPRENEVDFVSFIKSLSLYEKKYSDKPYTQTIYLDNELYPLPSEISIKLRRYSHRKSKVLTMFPQKEYILETKVSHYSNNEFVRKKVREQIKGDLIDKINLTKILEKFELILPKHREYDPWTPLKPIIGTQYKRKSYILNNEESVKVTIDTDLELFDFHNGEGTLNTSTKYLIIEVKDNDIKNRDTALQIINYLDKIGGSRTISKKCFAFNKLNYKRMKSSPKVIKTLPELEIEKKYQIDKINPTVLFCKIREIFDSHNNTFFIEDTKYHYSDYVGCIKEYWENDKTYITISIIGDEYRITKKSKEYSLKDMMRMEKKTDYKFLPVNYKTISDATFLGSSYRVKHKFWVVDKSTYGVYQISTDENYSQNESMKQLEIEFSGQLEDFSQKIRKKDARKGINEIGNIIQGNLGKYISTSRISKPDWVKLISK